MEINSEALFRFWWVLIEESKGVPNLLANLYLAISITLNGCRAFNVYPLSAWLLHFGPRYLGARA